MKALPIIFASAVVCCALLSAGPGVCAERFEVAAWIDHFDFAGVKGEDGYLFDSETVEGCSKILDHVREVGATTALWRNCGGATMRYQSAVESHHQEEVPDKRKVLDSRLPWGWVRYGAADPDLLRSALNMAAAKGMKPGVHWPFEETHWAIWTIGGWNLEHPHYWGRSVDGTPWWGRSSLAYEDVVEHKLQLVDELIDRGIQSLFIDTYRSGAWSPAYEYVPPVIEAYKKKYGVDPPDDPKDPQWCAHVAGYVTAYLRKVRERLDASGRKIDLMVGIYDISVTGNGSIINCAVDWRNLVEEGLIDTLVINWVRWDAKDPFVSTRQICRGVMDFVDGRCRVLWPVRAYDYSSFGMPAYQKATGLSQAEIAKRLMEMAWEEGASGVSLECVDYNNYAPATRKVMRELAEGKCKWAKEK